ncbi:sperm-specific sodium:proton exchanger-like isoform X2 [Ornithodoros turicata]|uniref:sperm-specific sodium:proton exchanger-like isoform X2 n=1 Tax=Ornithodoros turicata TaxID=34597 RepID=UPI003139BCA3
MRRGPSQCIYIANCRSFSACKNMSGNMSHEDGHYTEPDIHLSTLERLKKNDYELQTILFGIIFTVIFIACVLRSMERALGIPHTVVVVITAAIVSYFVPTSEVDEFLIDSCRCKFDVFITLLPALVFSTMNGINYYIVRKCYIEMAIFCIGTTAMHATLCSRFVALFLDGTYPSAWIIVLGCLFSCSQRESMFVTNLQKDRYPILSTMLNCESLVSNILAWDVMTFTYSSAVHDVGRYASLFLYLGISMLVGSLMAYLAMHVLTRVEPEPPYAVLVLMGLAYLTFMILESFGACGVSGVIAFSIITNNHILITSSDLEEHLTRYWTIIYELSEVIAIFIACIYTIELAKRFLSFKDILLILVTYIFVTCSRAISVLLTLPVLEYMDYHVRWQQAIVLVWFGMRGSFRLLLVLFYQRYLFVNIQIAFKGIIHVAGVVFLQSFVNPMLYSVVLRFLGLQKAMAGDEDTMLQALAYMRQMVNVSEKRQRSESYFMTVDWGWVAARTRMTARLITGAQRVQNKRLLRRRSTVTEVLQKENETAAYQIAIENALRIHQVSFSRQFQEGRIQRRTLLILLAALEYPYDTKEYLDAAMIRQLVAIPDWTYKLKKRWSGDEVVDPQHTGSEDWPTPQEWHGTTLREMMLDGFEHSYYGVVVVASTFAYILCSLGVAIAYYKNLWTDYPCIVIETIYVGTFMAEMLSVLYVHGHRFHRLDMYNKLDILLAVSSQVMLALHFAVRLSKERSISRLIAPAVMIMLCAGRLAHIFKYVDIPCRFLAKMIEARIDSVIYDSYEVALAMVTSEEEVQECISKTVDSEELAQKIRTLAGRNRLQVLKHLVSIQSNFPGVAVAFKSRQACQAVLNHVFHTVVDLHESGTLDRPEFRKVRREITAAMKRSLYAPRSFRCSYKPIAVLRSIPWLSKASLRQFIALKIRPVSYEPGETIIERKTHHDVIVTYSGVVKGYLIPKARVLEAIAVFTERPSFLYQLWTYIGRRVAAQLLQAHPMFQMWPTKKILLRLENIVLPNLEHARSFLVTPDIEEVVLIQGIIEDAEESSTYIGPIYIPRAVRKIIFPGEAGVRPLPVVVLIAKRHYRPPANLEWSDKVMADSGGQVLSEPSFSEEEKTSSENEDTPGWHLGSS